MFVSPRINPERAIKIANDLAVHPIPAAIAWHGFSEKGPGAVFARIYQGAMCDIGFVELSELTTYIGMLPVKPQEKPAAIAHGRRIIESVCPLESFAFTAWLEPGNRLIGYQITKHDPLFNLPNCYKLFWQDTVIAPQINWLETTMYQFNPIPLADDLLQPPGSDPR